MTPQEQQMIDGLISRVRSTDVQNKDTQAEQHIQQGLAGSPNALYVLVQTVLVQQYGLEQAQSQLRELKQQVQTLQAQAQQAPKSSSGGFLSHIFGSDPQPAQPVQTQGYQPVNNPGQQSYPAPPPPPYPGQGYPAQAYPGQSYPSQGGGMFGSGGGGLFGGGGGFLQGAMQTAAGVAAGELAFQGMEDLFHGFGGHERGFSGGGSSGETVVNNYYDEDRSGDRDTGDRGRDDSSFYNPSDDASRDTGSSDLSASDNFTDASSNDSSFDDNTSDDGGLDMGGDDFSSDNS